MHENMYICLRRVYKQINKCVYVYIYNYLYILRYLGHESHLGTIQHQDCTALGVRLLRTYGVRGLQWLDRAAIPCGWGLGHAGSKLVPGSESAPKGLHTSRLEQPKDIPDHTANVPRTGTGLWCQQLSPSRQIRTKALGQHVTDILRPKP